MFLYTVVSAEQLLYNDNLPACICKKIEGGYLEGEETPDGFLVSRLISTDPKVFLDERYAPGALYKG